MIFTPAEEQKMFILDGDQGQGVLDLQKQVETWHMIMNEMTWRSDKYVPTLPQLDLLSYWIGWLLMPNLYDQSKQGHREGSI